MKNHIATLRRIATIEKRAAVFPSVKARLERVMSARRAAAVNPYQKRDARRAAMVERAAAKNPEVKARLERVWRIMEEKRLAARAAAAAVKTARLATMKKFAAKNTEVKARLERVLRRITAKKSAHQTAAAIAAQKPHERRAAVIRKTETNHFNSPYYWAAVKALAICAASAEKRRGVSPESNPYRSIENRADYLQTAAAAYYAAAAAARLIGVEQTDGRIIYNFDALNGDCSPMVAACRAIERLEYSNRARSIVWKNGKARAAVVRKTERHKYTVTSYNGAETETTEEVQKARVDIAAPRAKAPRAMVAMKIDNEIDAAAVKENLISAIHAAARLSAARRQSLIDVVIGKREPSNRDRDYLKQIALSNHIARRCADGKLEIL